jgi:phenylalanine-4-hydroxylase
MLMSPAIADYLQAYGAGGLRAQQLGVLDKLARVYWYTVEFGLVQQKGGLRIYGAGIASSSCWRWRASTSRPCTSACRASPTMRRVRCWPATQ